MRPSELYETLGRLREIHHGFWDAEAVVIKAGHGLQNCKHISSAYLVDETHDVEPQIREYLVIEYQDGDSEA